MKRITLLLALLPLFAAADDVTVDLTQLSPGAKIDLNGPWPYKPGYALTPTDKPESDAKDEGFNPVPVPQILSRIRWWLDDSADFNAFEDARLKRLGFDTDKASDGWYRRWITVPELPAGKHLFVEFEGVAMRSKVFCNGKPLGEHAGMFSGFSFDLTPALKPGRNLLAVYVSMEKSQANAKPLGEAVTVNLTASKVTSMSKGMFGPFQPGLPDRAYDLHGIWQPVRLVVHGDAMIDDAWFKPSLDGADVEVTAHSLAGETHAQLFAKWTDKATGDVFVSGNVVEFDLKPGVPSNATIPLRNAKVKLWTPADPNLYELTVSLTTVKRDGLAVSGTTLDSWSHDVGFRTFEVKGTQLYLNGHPYWLRGSNQLPYGKNPTDPALARKLIGLMHDNNQRVTRTHATPWNEPWLDAADQIGLGVSVEGIRPWALVGKIGPCPPDMFKLWLDENEAVIKRGRNHPSVLIWTVGNEMMLRDTDNPEKWQQLSDVVKQTRALDPLRPVVCSSSYVRESKLYDKLLKPKGFDDGDLDDVHYYRGWYAPSPFVTDSLFEKEFKERGPTSRPLIGQEMAAGYPDLDSGLPVTKYTRDLITPQAWVGMNAYPGSDPAIFAEHVRAAAKRWAEQLRFQRGDRTAGFLLFSAECWFSHTYDPERVKPYPVIDSMKQAFAPVGLALETGRRRFYAGERLKTSVFLTNDDESFQDLANVDVRVQIVDADGKVLLDDKLASGNAAYYATVKLPIEFTMPQVAGARAKANLTVVATKNGAEVSRTTDPVELFERRDRKFNYRPSITFGLGPELTAFFHSHDPNDDVVFFGPGTDLATLKPLAAKGRTVVAFAPGKAIVDAFPDDVADYKDDVGEFADAAPLADTRLARGLQPTDLKWWGRKDDWRVFTVAGSHRLKPGGKARELIRFIPSHGYISAEKVPQQYRVAMFEIPVEKGRVWVCDLDLESSVNVDPVAALFAENLLNAAIDRHSTDKLPKLPTHEEAMKGMR